MAPPSAPPRASRGPATGSGRPGLVPANPLPLWRALVQVACLLGIPLALLVLAKLVVRRFFPDLGY